MASNNQNKGPSSSPSVMESFQKLEVNDMELQEEDKLIKKLEDLQEKFAKEEADKLEAIEELKRTKQELASAKEEIQFIYFAEKKTIEDNKLLQKYIPKLLEMVKDRDERLKCVEAEYSALTKYLRRNVRLD